jgi:DNA mismatch repair protein MutL
MARSLARAAAIKAGQPLSPEEMDRLMSDLFKLSSPGYTVDGRAVINVISTDDISKMF